MTLRRGLYETLITPRVEQALESIEEALTPRVTELRSAEAADRLALHVSSVLRQVLDDMADSTRTAPGLALTRALLELLSREAPENPETPGGGVTDELPSGGVLRAILGLLPDGRQESLPAPLIPLLDTTLLTNSRGEPRVGHQVAAEIESAERIDVTMAFIRRSGLGLVQDALRRHREAGRDLRILTTTYTGTTEASALDELQQMGAKVRVSYDTSMSRLHAKAWQFHRPAGFSTAYIGSSNLTRSAQWDGMEWNVRISGARNPDVLRKMSAVFETYWSGGEFVDYAREDFLDRTDSETTRTPRALLSPVEIRLEPFQERMLEQISLARAMGHHRNLLVSATGTGKTVMAAMDYLRLREELPRARLLFVAHRKEILEQSLATFRQALRDPAFGELWVGGQRPRAFEHVFASVQSLSARGAGLRQGLDPSHFDVIIVDEFHHAAAPSYQRLREELSPRELLGLTATPERSDGLPLLQWFDDRIAAELRLWDAIDQHRLCPFQYYGIADTLDLREVPWRRGRGYDLEAVSNLITANDSYARTVAERLAHHCPDIRSVKALGFCVSVDHARFMARVFQQMGWTARAVWADSTSQDREQALSDLAAGHLQVLFSVDLFNEGVDLPNVDTVLFLRPTDSPTLFLQQLGRGLRRARGKSCCTVLDFVGRHRREFRMDRRYQALLGGTRRGLVEQIQQGFPFLPAGCHMELDRVAADRVLESIRNAIPSRWKEKAAELSKVARARREETPPSPIGLQTFLEESGYELSDIYGKGRGWSALKEEAGLATAPAGPHETTLRRAPERLLHVDDRERIEAYRGFLAPEGALRCGRVPEALPERQGRLLRMMTTDLCTRLAPKGASLMEGLELLRDHPQVLDELDELLAVLEGRLPHLTPALEGRPEIPLRVHARYSRIEVLAALGVGSGAHLAPWQTGVYWAKDARSDLLAFTLDKTRGQFSPTTRYRDYAISRDLVHWESQSITRADSTTGLRYRGHRAQGSSILLFARKSVDERAFWFLGPATYVQHEGERPMAITWRLQHPLPGDLFAEFAAAVA